MECIVFTFSSMQQCIHMACQYLYVPVSMKRVTDLLDGCHPVQERPFTTVTQKGVNPYPLPGTFKEPFHCSQVSITLPPTLKLPGLHVMHAQEKDGFFVISIPLPGGH